MFSIERRQIGAPADCWLGLLGLGKPAVFRHCALAAWLLLLAAELASGQAVSPPDTASGGVRAFSVKGTVKEVKPGDRTVVIKHEAIPGYMDAMTMPFKVQKVEELTNVMSGDLVSFRLQVTDTESWIDQVKRTGSVPAVSNAPVVAVTAETKTVRPHHPLMDYQFTNELGKAVSLGDFRGQALAITFFFTRCPIPEYCPRLS